MNARNGKIARLPRSVREQLNERLEQSDESPELLAWLNALPEVKSVLEEHFGGVQLNKMNLTRWRQGGFQEWLARRDFREEIRSAGEFSEELREQCSLKPVADNAAIVLAAQFAGFISRWNGQTDKNIKAKANLLNGLCSSVVRLQRGAGRPGQERPATAPMPEKVKTPPVTVDNAESRHSTSAPDLSSLILPSSKHNFS